MNVTGTAPLRDASISKVPARPTSYYLDLAVLSLLWIYLASLPFRRLLFIERNGFVLLIILLVCWSVFHRRLFWRPTPLDVPLLAFVGWVAVTIPFASFPAYSLKEFGKLLQGGIIFYAVLYFFRDEVSRRRLVYLFVGLTFPIALYGFTQYDPMNQQVMTSFLSSEVWLTTYLVLFIPLCFGVGYGAPQSWLRWLGFGIGVSASLCLILTRSRAGFVALAVELLCLAWVFRRWRGGVLGMVAMLVFMGAVWLINLAAPVSSGQIGQVVPMNKNVSSIVHRLDIWKFSLAEIQQHPLFGIGLGGNTFMMLYGQEAEQVEPGHAAVRQAGTHNILLYYALHVGIPGAMLFFFVMLGAVKKLYVGVQTVSDRYAYGVIHGVLISIIGGLLRFQFDMMFVGSLAVLFWMLLAVGIMHLPEEERRMPVAVG